MRYNWIIGLVFISIDLFSQRSYSNSSSSKQTDSLELWSYDILTLNENDNIGQNNPICKIVFFRNTGIKDSLYDDLMKNGPNYDSSGLRPAMIFIVFPISMINIVKAVSDRIKILSSCTYPDVGGNYYILRSFVLLNYTSCTMCSSPKKHLDLCRGNIDRIISVLRDKRYLSFEQLCSDLPIKKEKYYK